MAPNALAADALARLPQELHGSWTVAPNGCVHWTRWAPNPAGYCKGSFRGRRWSAHRLVLDLLGVHVTGWTVDHTCHNIDPHCLGGTGCKHRQCVNPAHLELVTRGENVLRGKTRTAANSAKTACALGHPYDVSASTGWRTCGTCHNARVRLNRALARVVPPSISAGLSIRSGDACEARLPGCVGAATDVCFRVRRDQGGRHGSRDLRFSAIWHGCRSCHRWTYDYPERSRDLGLTVEGEASEQRSFTYRGKKALLRDDGSLVEVATADPMWTITDGPIAICGATRPRGRVRCELPPDHVVGRNVEPMPLDWHTGRGRDGRWLTWPVEVPDA